MSGRRNGRRKRRSRPENPTAADFINTNPTLHNLPNQHRISRDDLFSVALEEANVKLRSQAERDGLTGVGNRAYFDSRLAAACATARRSDDPLALLMIDVDHFKPYNDQHGHLAGDEALRHLARVLSQDVRESTAVARYGGEEFALIAERCTADAAERLARRLVAEVANDELPLTISIGVATFDASVDDDPSSLVRRADDALYVAKRDGRNRVAVSDGSELRGA